MTTSWLTYNTLIVLLGTGLLGANAGLVGTFAVLRGRSLTGDALAHAALPGLALAFLIVGQRSLPAMLAGALMSGLLGVAVISVLSRTTRIKQDAAIGIVLSVFFGAGVVLSRIVQNTPGVGSKAGLDSYILGKTAGIIRQDVYVIGAVSLASLLLVTLVFKEFRLIIFDPDFARVQGWPVLRLDLVLMGLIALATVFGLPMVGVVLMAALLILPGASARFWTDRLGILLSLATVFGLVIGLIGTTLSARFSAMPAGPIIVLVGTAVFLLSVLIAPKRGLLGRAIATWRFRRSLDERRILETIYDLIEPGLPVVGSLDPIELRSRDPGSARRAEAAIARLIRQRVIVQEGGSNGSIVLTDEGLQRAGAVARGSRLWERFMIAYPEQSASLVDLSQESIESILPSALVAELQQALRDAGRLPDFGPREAAR